MEQYMVVKSL